MHITTFYTRLNSAELSERPHSALINAMVSLRSVGRLTAVSRGERCLPLGFCTSAGSDLLPGRGARSERSLAGRRSDATHHVGSASSGFADHRMVVGSSTAVRGSDHEQHYSEVRDRAPGLPDAQDRPIVRLRPYPLIRNLAWTNASRSNQAEEKASLSSAEDPDRNRRKDLCIVSRRDFRNELKLQLVCGHTRRRCCDWYKAAPLLGSGRNQNSTPSSMAGL